MTPGRASPTRGDAGTGAGALVAALWLVASCSSGPPVPVLAPTAFEHQALRELIGRALAADAALEDADSLYIVGAIVVADGRNRPGAPRFAGLRPGGRATVVGSALEISSYLAWASVDYRWVAGDGRSGVTGRATFVLERLGGTWRIKHLHSSSVNQP